MLIWFISILPFMHQQSMPNVAYANSVERKSNATTPAKLALTRVAPAVKKTSLDIVSMLPKEISSISSLWMLEAHEPAAPTGQYTAASSFLANSYTPIESKKVTLNLSSTAIESVISILSQQTGINIVLMSKGDQKITINVKDMPLEDALKHLAMLASLKTLTVKSTVIMAEEATLKGAYPKEYAEAYEVPVKIDPPTVQPPQEENIQKVFTLKYQGATQATNALKEYLSTKKVTILALPNTVIPNLANNNGGMSSGNSGLGNSGGVQTQSSTGVTEGRAKRVLLSGPSEAIAEAIKILELMDIPRKQVEITVTIHDVSNDGLREAGITWEFGQTTLTETVSGNANIGTFARTGLSFVGTLKAMEQANKAKLLASPNVSVMDGEQGSILIGERRRFPVVNGTTANGQFIYSTEEQNVGISLLVATDVAEDGTVTMAVNAQVSSILGFLQLNGGSYPQISTRESKSTLHLKDGQTMVMGGLIREEEIVNFQKVPFLGQIPFFGELFKNRKTQKNTSQLLISITPRVVK